MYERRQSFCEFVRWLRRATTINARARGDCNATAHHKRTMGMIPRHSEHTYDACQLTPTPQPMACVWAAARPASQLVGPRQAPSPLVLVTSSRAHGDHNATLRHKRSMSMIPTHEEQAHDAFQQPSAPQLMAGAWAAAIDQSTCRAAAGSEPARACDELSCSW